MTYESQPVVYQMAARLNKTPDEIRAMSVDDFGAMVYHLSEDKDG